jgi:hypothetical protein
MRHSILLHAAFALLPLCAFGRLGESEQELAARYGPPVSRVAEIAAAQGRGVEFGTRLTFRQGDWTVECVMIDGRSAKEVCGKDGDWTGDQVDAVLRASAQGERWTDMSPEITKRVSRKWRRSDGAVAMWNWKLGMTLVHPAYERARRDAEAKAKAGMPRSAET